MFRRQRIHAEGEESPFEKERPHLHLCEEDGWNERWDRNVGREVGNEKVEAQRNRKRSRDEKVKPVERRETNEEPQRNRERDAPRGEFTTPKPVDDRFQCFSQTSGTIRMRRGRSRRHLKVLGHLSSRPRAPSAAKMGKLTPTVDLAFLESNQGHCYLARSAD